MSHDAACGPFYFDPKPLADQPISITVSVSPSRPTVRQPVTFHAVMDDPDGAIGCIARESDGVMGVASECGLPPMCDRFGAWPPPPPSPGHDARDFRQTYQHAGQYTFQIDIASYNSACVNARTGRGEMPYVSAGSASTTITVS